MTWLSGLVAALVLVIVLAAVIPTAPPSVASHSAPARDYADAVARVAKQQAADDRVVAPGGRSVLLTHGKRTARVVVLFHGYTNSPAQYQHFAERLYAAGDNVYVPRLPHHAERHGTAGTLATLTADELRQCADSAIDIADGLGDSVIASGVSAGGTIVAWVAQYRHDVHRAIIVSPVLEIGRIPSFLGSPLMRLALRVPNVTRNETPDPLRPDRDLGVSTRAVAELLQLGVAVRDAARHTPPAAHDIVFVTNANDHTVKTPPTVELARRWNQHGAAAIVYQFPRSLGLPHDIAEEAHPNARPQVVYPALEALIHGDPPPPVLMDHRLWPR